VYVIVSETEKDGPYLIENYDTGTREYTLCLNDGKGTTALRGRKFTRESLSPA
jgi:hypothetical protein